MPRWTRTRAIGSGTLISRERRATTAASGGFIIVHRCSRTVEFTQSPGAESRASGGRTRSRPENAVQVCKPNSVCSLQGKRQPFLWAADCSLALATYPGVMPAEADVKRAASPPLFGLAPGGVCRAPVIADGAVSSYLAFSPFPCACDTTHRGTRWYVFCDTFRLPPLAGRGAPAVHGAPCSLEFGLSSPGHPSPGAAARPAW
jgi:hypothetical protein